MAPPRRRSGKDRPPPMPIPPTTSPRRPGAHPLLLLAVVALAHVVFGFVLTRNTPFPYVPDDWSFLAGRLADLSLHWKRPVSSNAIFVIAAGGQLASYVALNAFTVLVAWLALLVVRAVTGIAPGVMAAVAGAALVASHASTLEHTKYLGLITSLVSHAFGLLGLLLLWRAWRGGGLPTAAGAVLAVAASAFAKEDFLLPPLLLLALMLWRGAGNGAPVRPAVRALLLVAVPMVVAGSLAWQALDRNPFVAGLFVAGGGSGSYAVDLAPAALARALWTLFAGYSGLATLLALAAWVLLWLRRRALRPQLLWFAATVLALALPYAVIPNNMPPYRAYAWLPWLGAIVAVALASEGVAARRRRAVAGLSLGMAALVAMLQHGPRVELAGRYAIAEAVNRRMLDAVEQARPAIAGAPLVGLHGLDGPSPWCGNGTLFLQRKRGFDQAWRLFADGESACYRNATAGARHDLRMSVAAPATACDAPGLPVLLFAPDGSGRLGTAAEVCALARAPR